MILAFIFNYYNTDCNRNMNINRLTRDGRTFKNYFYELHYDEDEDKRFSLETVYQLWILKN